MAANLHAAAPVGVVDKRQRKGASSVWASNAANKIACNCCGAHYSVQLLSTAAARHHLGGEEN